MLILRYHAGGGGGGPIAVGQCMEELLVYTHDERKPVEPSRVPESVQMMRHAVQHGDVGYFWRWRHVLSCNLAVRLVHNPQKVHGCKLLHCAPTGAPLVPGAVAGEWWGLWKRHGIVCNKPNCLHISRRPWDFHFLELCRGPFLCSSGQNIYHLLWWSCFRQHAPSHVRDHRQSLRP